MQNADQEPAPEPSRRSRSCGEGRGRAGRAPDDLRQHGAGGAGPDDEGARITSPSTARTSCTSGMRRRTSCSTPPTSGYYLLLSGRWFREPVPHGRTVGVRPARQGPGRLREDSRDAPARALCWRPSGHVAGPGSASSTTASPRPPRSAGRPTTYRTTLRGTPKFQPIEGTSLQYAVNTPDPVILVDPKSYYALKDGVWFTAAMPTGPCGGRHEPSRLPSTRSRSARRFTTSPTSRSTGRRPRPCTGYTPGYYGTGRRAEHRVVVYGTGYVYPPVYVGSRTGIRRRRPTVTGAGFGWGAVTGFAFWSGHRRRLGRRLGLLRV